MVRTNNVKVLLSEYNNDQFRKFLLDDAKELLLYAPSIVPGIGGSEPCTFYKKASDETSDACIKLITSKSAPPTLLWQTTAKQLKQSVRWGVIKTHALTSQVIAELGEYRITVLNRLNKGLISNTHHLKWALLDVFQDRLEALQKIEILINTQADSAEIKEALNAYCDKLMNLQNHLPKYFANVDPALSPQETIAFDLREDRERVAKFLKQIEKSPANEVTKAKGKHSLLRFIKKQMVYNLSELQGINQDLSFSRKRAFALTRGTLNDCVENALKRIETHKPHLANAVNPNHQGIFSNDPNKIITYNFSEDDLSPTREREVIQAISFIEGWDKIIAEKDGLYLANKFGKEKLEEVKATRWGVRKNFRTFMKSIGYYIQNIFLSFFKETKPTQVHVWSNPKFSLVGVKLCENFARPNEPLWKKPVHFFRLIKNGVRDAFFGVKDFRDDLIFHTPEEIINDWNASSGLPDIDVLLSALEEDIISIHHKEQARLKFFQKLSGHVRRSRRYPVRSKLSDVDYSLVPEEDHHPLLSISKGLTEFSNLVLHQIFAQDPIGGLVFSCAYSIGVCAVYAPQWTATLTGEKYVRWFNNFSFAMSHSVQGAALSGSSAQAQLAAASWDTLLHGPSGRAMNGLYKLGEDPLTYGAYFSAAYSLGFFLVNGIAGYKIPWISQQIQNELGRIPEVSYPVVGVKGAILVHEGLSKKADTFYPVFSKTSGCYKKIDSDELKVIKRRRDLVNWLRSNSYHLPKADPDNIYFLSRHIDRLFPENEAKSLKKILYPKESRSIAFQLFSRPLSYITAVLRVVIAIPLVLFAFRKGKEKSPYPLAPLKRASNHLFDKVKNDFFIVTKFAEEIAYLFYNVIASMLKMVGVLFSLLIARIGSLFHCRVSHGHYRTFAGVHNCVKDIGENLTPSRMFQPDAVPHPNHTLNAIETSYVKLMKSQLQKEDVKSMGSRGKERNYASRFSFPKGNTGPEEMSEAGDLSPRRLARKSDSNMPKLPAM